MSEFYDIGSRASRGLGCLMGLALVGFVTAAAGLAWGAWWLAVHVRVSVQ